MATQYFGVTALQTQPGLASDWLRNMSSAAHDAGITLTLSKALPRILMEASQYPAVIQVSMSGVFFNLRRRGRLETEEEQLKVMKSKDLKSLGRRVS